MGFDLSSMKQDAGVSEFLRCSNIGMAVLCEVLFIKDALDNEMEPPLLPDLPEPRDEHFADDGSPLTTKAREYISQVEPLLHATGPQGKVPLYKLASTDGWVITGEECTVLLSALGSVDPVAVSTAASSVANELSEAMGEDYSYLTEPPALEELCGMVTSFRDFVSRCRQLGGLRVE